MLQIDKTYDQLLDNVMVKTNQAHYWAKEHADEVLEEDSDAMSSCSLFARSLSHACF